MRSNLLFAPDFPVSKTWAAFPELGFRTPQERGRIVGVVARRVVEHERIAIEVVFDVDLLAALRCQGLHRSIRKELPARSASHRRLGVRAYLDGCASLLGVGAGLLPDTDDGIALR